MNNKALNCPNCGEKLECTKVDYLLGKHEYRCNNCHKQYSAKYNSFFYFITLFIIFTIANLLSRYILNQFSIVNYEWIISSVIWLIIVAVIFAIANKIEYIRKKTIYYFGWKKRFVKERESLFYFKLFSLFSLEILNKFN